MATIGYARVSRPEQDPALQEDALLAAGCERIYAEQASGVFQERPELAKCLRALGSGDVLVVWKFDRLGRNLRHFLDVVADLGARGIGLRSLSEGVDTTTPAGRLYLHLFGALAEFERDIIRERTLAGMAAARQRGRLIGRKPVMNPRKLAVAKQMYATREHTLEQIAATLGVSRSSVIRALRAARHVGGVT